GAIPDSVDAAVAHVGQVHPFLRDAQSHDGRPHASLFGVLLGGLVDPQIAQLDAGDEAVFLVAAAPVHFVGPGLFGVVCGLGEELPHGLYGQARGDLARGVATHAVCNDVQSILAENRVVVFVVSAFATNVGLTGNFNV